MELTSIPPLNNRKTIASLMISGKQKLLDSLNLLIVSFLTLCVHFRNLALKQILYRGSFKSFLPIKSFHHTNIQNIDEFCGKNFNPF